MRLIQTVCTGFLEPPGFVPSPTRRKVTMGFIVANTALIGGMLLVLTRKPLGW